jgi:hypothetical protein
VVLLYLNSIVNNYIPRGYLLLPEIIKIITTGYKPAVFLARLIIRTISIFKREKYVSSITINNL